MFYVTSELPEDGHTLCETDRVWRSFARWFWL